MKTNLILEMLKNDFEEENKPVKNLFFKDGSKVVVYSDGKNIKIEEAKK